MGRLFKLLAMTLVLAALVCCVLVSCDKDDVTTPAVTDGSDTSEGGTDQTTVGASETTSEDTSAGGTTAPVERVEPNSITEGKVRVQLLSDGLVRTEASRISRLFLSLTGTTGITSSIVSNPSTVKSS